MALLQQMEKKPTKCRYCQQELHWIEHKSPHGDSSHAKCCSYDYAFIGTTLLVEKEER